MKQNVKRQRLRPWTQKQKHLSYNQWQVILTHSQSRELPVVPYLITDNRTYTCFHQKMVSSSCTVCILSSKSESKFKYTLNSLHEELSGYLCYKITCYWEKVSIMTIFNWVTGFLFSVVSHFLRKKQGR